MSDQINSELEKTNLEVHVDMARQRYFILTDKVEMLDNRMNSLSEDLAEFRSEHTKNIAELKDLHATAIHNLRKENALNAQSTTKIFVGAAATVIAGIISTIIVVLVTFL